jgi:2'-5' RNA ligase
MAMDSGSNGPSPPPAARLFIALWPGPRVRHELAACRDATPWPAGAAPVASEKLHLTLHFIGSVPIGRTAELAAALQVPVTAFQLRLDVVALWRGGRGGLAVLCPSRVPPGLQKLHADLAAALRQQALPVESRVFRPHVTLARRAPACQPVAPAGPVRWGITGHALVQSLPAGSYRVLQRYR